MVEEGRGVLGAAIDHLRPDLDDAGDVVGAQIDKSVRVRDRRRTDPRG
jgi:hypothetical protein